MKVGDTISNKWDTTFHQEFVIVGDIECGQHFGSTCYSCSGRLWLAIASSPGPVELLNQLVLCPPDVILVKKEEIVPEK